MDTKKLQEIIITFRNERNWKQFHRPKDVAMDISVEAAEILEHFLWKNESEIEEYLKNPENKKAVAEEVCDVLHATLLLAHELDIDIDKEFVEKMEKNKIKYPLSNQNHQIEKKQ